MAQALGSFVDAGITPVAPTVANTGGRAGASDSVAFVVSSMADAMQQFDAHGQQVAVPGLGVASPSAPKFYSGSPPGSGGVLASTEPK
jgi:hypothetical protein